MINTIPLNEKVKSNYEWVIVGGGIAGITLAEILTREGHDVLLVEKEDKLAAVTTRDFHEWMHVGSLYTLIPDKLVTLKYILGAVDDLLEYYSAFKNMNLSPTERGLNIKSGKAWFNKRHIFFKYRIQNRKFTFPWLIGVSRSVFLIRYLKGHDWLRRRAGVIDDFGLSYFKGISKIFWQLLKFKNKFFSIETPDFTMNSRILIRDIVTTAIKNGLNLSVGNQVISIEKKTDGFSLIKTKKFEVTADKVILCCAVHIKDFLDVNIKTSYAPMAIVDNLPEKTNSFVELDYFPKNCINLLTKDNKVGLIGGITVNNKEDTKAYIEYVIKEHKKIHPDIKVLGDYVGLKNEIIFKNQDRNYLYHIIKSKNQNIWSVVPGKFSLVFSLAPEFYRQVYKKNPKKYFQAYEDDGAYSDLVSETVWTDFYKDHKLLNRGKSNGNDSNTRKSN